MSRSTRSGKKRKTPSDQQQIPPAKSKRQKTDTISRESEDVPIHSMLSNTSPYEEALLPPPPSSRHQAIIYSVPGTSKDVDMNEQEFSNPVARNDHVVKAKRHPRRNLMKPTKGSWVSHAGSILIYRCIQSALKQSQDYRDDIESTDWAQVKDDLGLTADDLKVLWVLINKEYKDLSLESVEEDLRPYSLLSVDRFTREDTKLKFKDEMPKPPLSAYMLYSKSIIHKVKEKYADLPSKQIMTKIGQKWQALSEDRKKKFRDEYTVLREDYSEKMKDFLEKHPEAKPTRARRRNDQPRKDRAKRVRLVDPEVERIRELKALKPKCPTTAFAIFCNHRKDSVAKKNPHLTPKEVTAKLSERWKAKGEKDKAKYKKEFIDLHAVYKEQLKQFYETFPEAKILLAKKTKKAVSADSEAHTESKQIPSSGEDDEVPHHHAPSFIPLTGPSSSRKKAGLNHQNGIESNDEQSYSSDSDGSNSSDSTV